MIKRVVLLAAATIAMTAGCSSAAGSTSLSAPAQGPTTKAATIRPTTAATTEPTGKTIPKGQPTTPKTAPAKVDWVKLVQPCPYHQKSIVKQTLTAYGVTGQKVQDTLVARTCDPITGYWPDSVEVFEGTHRFFTLLIDPKAKNDVPWFKSMNVAPNGDIVIVALGQGEHGDYACLNETVTYRYRHMGDGFEDYSRTAVPSKSCLPKR